MFALLLCSRVRMHSCMYDGNHDASPLCHNWEVSLGILVIILHCRNLWPTLKTAEPTLHSVVTAAGRIFIKRQIHISYVFFLSENKKFRRHLAVKQRKMFLRLLIILNKNSTMQDLYYHCNVSEMLVWCNKSCKWKTKSWCDIYLAQRRKDILDKNPSSTFQKGRR